MVFSSAIFLYIFLPVVLTVYWLTPRTKRMIPLTLASWVFYGWWRPDFVLLMVLQSVADWLLGIRIGREQARGRKGKVWMVASVILNLGLLSYFKYANFGIESFNAILTTFGWTNIKWTEVVLPVGISFYTFQTMSYVIDVYWKHVDSNSRFWEFMGFVAMFPQLVAGPIVRYRDVETQLPDRSFRFERFAQGALAFQSGFCKKILIADIVAGVADDAFALGSPTPAAAWLGALAYSVQIYFDFSGYSDMALGLGLMIGFRFPVNFNRPYIADSITDFWRRWHISLSTWLRDYLYVPLGGNRKGPVRTYVNLALTMLLGGLWHGAQWTFIVWGAWQGFWLIIERLAKKRSLIEKAPRFVRVAWTMVLVLIGWVLFRAHTLPDAWRFLGAMSGIVRDGTSGVFPNDLQKIVLVIAAAVIWLFPTTQSSTARPRLVWAAFLQFFFVLAILQLHYQAHVPFLYFQF